MIGQRKDDHVRLAVEQQREHGGRNQFDDVSFVHHALAGIDRPDVSLATTFAGISWQVPLYVNAMTGGSTKTGVINRDLAIAACETGVPLASGSMSAYFEDPSCADTFWCCARRTRTGSSWRTSTRRPRLSRRGEPSTCCGPTPCRSTSTQCRKR